MDTVDHVDLVDPEERPAGPRVSVAEGTGFVADAMLGGLARWLRLAGCDVLYDARLDDNELVRLTRQRGRVLLTRDRQLSQRRGLRAVYVVSERPEEQLHQVLCAFGGACGEPRCGECNGALRPVGREGVEGEVPAYVWATQEEYRRCLGCGRIYWPGTHWQGIRDTLRSARADCGPGSDT